MIKPKELSCPDQPTKIISFPCLSASLSPELIASNPTNGNTFDEVTCQYLSLGNVRPRVPSLASSGNLQPLSQIQLNVFNSPPTHTYPLQAFSVYYWSKERQRNAIDSYHGVPFWVLHLINAFIIVAAAVCGLGFGGYASVTGVRIMPCFKVAETISNASSPRRVIAGP